MANFEISEDKTLKWEGGYANVVGDKGGETIFGIARAMNPHLKLWNDVDNYKKALAPFNKSKYKELEILCKGNVQFVEEMKNFYRKQFWDPIKGDKINDQDIANAIYDFAVNSGVRRAVLVAQATLNIVKDGKFGRQTLEAVNKAGSDFVKHYCDNRVEFLKIRSKRGSNAKFLQGWLNRVGDFYIQHVSES
ncbi:glycoside hydrolase family 108 protein [Helicobacter equorum]|uniref:glycoside hydrolase family 108 protein n=1 Tax=Helicobacter equorum TaxID=361872 RepID=UPI000CF048A2|nr:glycosyl hydrolase 108 family protein [Helicobacter equorum]